MSGVRMPSSTPGRSRRYHWGRRLGAGTPVRVPNDFDPAAGPSRTRRTRMRTQLLPPTLAFCFAIAAPAMGVGQTHPRGPRRPRPTGGSGSSSRFPGDGQGGAAASYRVSYRGRPVILPSRLGVDVADGPGLGDGSAIEEVRSADHRRDVHPASGQAKPGRQPLRGGDRRAPRACRAAAALGGRPSGLRRRGRLAVSVPRPGGLEGTRDRRRADAVPPARRRRGLHALPLNGYTTSHEARYQNKAVAEIPDGLAARAAAARRSRRGSAGSR